MLRGYRLAIIALGLTLFAAMGSGHSQVLEAQKQEPQTAPQANNSTDQVDEAANAAFIEERSDNAISEELPRDKPTQDAHESRLLELDLAAQQRMADAAEELLVYTKGQTIIGAIGAVVLIGTLWVSVFVAIRQLRAYVTVADFQILTLEIGKPLEVCIVFRNSGQTPARNVYLTVLNSLREANLGPKDFSIKLVRGSTGVIGAGTENKKWIETPVDIDRDIHDAVMSREHCFYFYGIIEYRDVFYIRRETRFFYFLIGNKKDTFRISTHAEGNSAT